MTTVDQLQRWLQDKENASLEFKEARDTYSRDKLDAYCVAIANEGGGKFILGVTDALPRAVVGTKAFGNVTDTEGKLFQRLGFRVDVEELTHPDGRVLIFHIPTRVGGSAYNVDGRYLMRSGESIVPMSEDRLRAIFGEGRPHWAEEHCITDLAPADVVALLNTQSLFDLLKQPYPTTQDAVLSKLTSEMLVDKVAGGYAIRRLGAVLLAKKLSDFSDLAGKAPRVIVYTSDSKNDVRLDQISEEGYAVGFQQLVRLVMDQLPRNEIIENALRQEVSLLPDVAIRELIANALVHQDLTMTGMRPTIEVYPNRVEITNPGTPIVPVDRFIDGYESRNVRLADFMRRMSICEERSSGVDRVIITAEAHQLPAPHFGTTYGRTAVTIFGPKGFDDMSRDDRIRACYQHSALKWVMKEHMTNQSLRSRFGLADGREAVASQIISSAIDAELIKQDKSSGESRRYARYLPFWA